jgi:thiol-disulfide isomerase/thioredoxin
MIPLFAAAALAAGAPVALQTVSAAEVLEAVRRPGAAAVVVNLWATWCLPCREEFPDLVRIGKDYRDRGVRVLFVSTDFVADRDRAVAFLASQGVTGPSFIKDDGSDAAFIDALDRRWTGIIPATLLFDADGRARWLHEGKTDYAMLRAALEGVLVAPPAAPQVPASPLPSDTKETP